MGDCLYALPCQMSVALQAAPHATLAHDRNWRQRISDGVNEQRTWSRFLLLVARCFCSLLRFFHIYIYYTRFCSSTVIISSLWLTFSTLFLEYCLQSFFMLTTVHPYSWASCKDFSCSRCRTQHRCHRWRAASAARCDALAQTGAMGSSHFALPVRAYGRRPMRLDAPGLAGPRQHIHQVAAVAFS